MQACNFILEIVRESTLDQTYRFEHFRGGGVMSFLQKKKIIKYIFKVI